MMALPILTVLEQKNRQGPLFPNIRTRRQQIEPDLCS